MPERIGFTTRQLHAGRQRFAATPRATPVYLTAGFEFDDVDHAADHFGTGNGFGYTRTGNPTIRAVEAQLAALEGGADALLVASGQSAVATALLTVAGAGDHVVVAEQVYEGTRGLILDNLARLGITATFVTDVADAAQWRAAIRTNTRALLAESLSNARNDVLDVAAVAAVADAAGIPLIVDNTLATAYLFRPLEHGAAMVVHSASKFLAGHGAVLGGVLVDDGRFDPAQHGARLPHLVAQGRTGDASPWVRAGGLARLAYARDSVAPRFGPTISPWHAFLIGQGAETLSLRLQRQCANALAVAHWLQERPEVAGVDYVGLPEHPHHALGRRYLSGGSGAVFTFTLRGGLEAARHIVQSLCVFTHMTHLGDVRSLVLHPRSTSHVSRTDQQCAAAGVFPGTLRLSVGIEDLADLLADLEAAFATLPVTAEHPAVAA